MGNSQTMKDTENETLNGQENDKLYFAGDRESFTSDGNYKIINRSHFVSNKSFKDTDLNANINGNDSYQKIHQIYENEEEFLNLQLEKLNLTTVNSLASEKMDAKNRREKVDVQDDTTEMTSDLPFLSDVTQSNFDAQDEDTGGGADLTVGDIPDVTSGIPDVTSGEMAWTPHATSRRY